MLNAYDQIVTTFLSKCMHTILTRWALFFFTTWPKPILQNVSLISKKEQSSLTCITKFLIACRLDGINGGECIRYNRCTG
jgi:hypothetical protein